MELYLVGGAVRDKLLGLPVKDRDWAVIGATAEQLEAMGFRRLDRNFPVFKHPQTGEEYALARREIKVAAGHKGFRVHAGPDVTLEDDLRRRDLTINAMAEAQDGTLIDPFGGRNDLDNGLLRNVSAAFVEDPLRVLRVARFAARFARWGFRVAHQTHILMKRMVDAGELAELSAQRIWWEMERALAENRPVRYFEVLHRCGALTWLFPELHHALGSAVSHRQLPEPTDPRSLRILAAAAKLSSDPVVRFAAFMQGLGNEVPQGGKSACDVILRVAKRFRVERSYEELALMVCHHFSLFELAHAADAKTLLAGLEAVDALRRLARFRRYLSACQAVAVGDGWDPDAARKRLETVFAVAQAVDAQALVEQGLDGASLADALRRTRIEAISAVVGLRRG
jgi:tRNA nucleotidyltransferase (CCA-adding enzyme)